MSTDARVRLAFVGMHPSRRSALEARLGGPLALVEAIAEGRVEVPERARATAGRSHTALLGELGAGTRLVLSGEVGYPPSLAALPDRPDGLFVRGTVPPGDAVAIVGSRAATRYGLGLAERLGRAFAAAGYVVVSGLARGVDAAAHRGGIASTVAVFGCGIDRWYPAANRELGLRILDAGGALVSEYAPGTPPAPWRFPLRNRVVSGLARVVVVVEAAVTGGALITARSALAQGREVLAVPGDLGRRGSGRPRRRSGPSRTGGDPPLGRRARRHGCRPPRSPGAARDAVRGGARHRGALGGGGPDPGGCRPGHGDLTRANPRWWVHSAAQSCAASS